MNTTNLKFNSILQALSYIVNCPMCNSTMIVDNKSPYCYLEGNLLINDNRDWNISISINEDSVTITESPQVLFMDNDFTAFPKYNPSPIAHILGTQIICSNGKCGKYKYVFIFRVNTMSKPVISDIILNAERMIFNKSNGSYYVINNLHSLHLTRYSIRNDDADADEINIIDLPFIQFDYDNPNKTLEKVKNLIIFT